jgi:acetyl esterase
VIFKEDTIRPIATAIDTQDAAPPSPPEPPLSLRERIEGEVARLSGALPARLQLLLAGGKPVRVDGEVLDPGVQLALRSLALQGMKSVSGAEAPVDPEPDTVRASSHRMAIVTNRRPTPVGSVRELQARGADGPLRARHYGPSDAGGPHPLLVFIHGGGMVIGDLETHDEPCRLLCRHGAMHVLSIEYRLAPEHPFPAPVEDSLAAFRWAAAHAAELGADPDRVAIGGDSAGGNLSAVVSQLAARDGGPAPALQLLIYPNTTYVHRPGGDPRFGHGFLLTDDDRRWFDGHYLRGTGTEPSDPRVSPLLAEDLTGVAPAIVVTAAFDMLRDEGERYADALREAGVRVVKHRAAGMIHGFIQMTMLRGPRDATVELAGMARAALAKPRSAAM